MPHLTDPTQDNAQQPWRDTRIFVWGADGGAGRRLYRALIDFFPSLTVAWQLNLRDAASELRAPDIGLLLFVRMSSSSEEDSLKYVLASQHSGNLLVATVTTLEARQTRSEYVLEEVASNPASAAVMLQSLWALRLPKASPR